MPGFASDGGGLNKDRALLVDIPATALCTFVPIAPGGRGGRDSFVAFGARIIGGLGGLGTFSRPGFDRLLEGAPTREVGIGKGDGGTDSQSDSVMGGGESGLGGGRTSPGTVILRFRFFRARCIAPGVLADPTAARALSSLSVILGGGVFLVSLLLPCLARLACGDTGTGVGSREGGFGKA